MRKLVTLIFISLGIVLGLTYSDSEVEIVPNHITTTYFSQISQETQEDLEFIRDSVGQPLTLSFSHDKHFYRESIRVSIVASNPDARIYFTLDGSQPSETSEVYYQPQEFISNASINCVVLKAVAIDDRGTSAIVTQSYFIGDSIDERFSCFVFSLSTDAANLYGYEEGILVPGKTYDDYMAAKPDAVLEYWQEPGNFRNRGAKWERPVYVEVFTAEGQRIIAQNAGMRVHGGATRYLPQKSLRLIARRRYEADAGTFKAWLFDDYLSIGKYGSPITSFDTLILRNDGNDWHNGRIRTPLASRIAFEAGFTTVSPQAGAAVFINGEYYTFAWINIRITEHYLEKLYNAPERAFDIVEGGAQSVTSDDKDIVAEFNTILAYAKQGFTEETLQYVENSFDIDNLLLYYAIQVYVGNQDFPHNNIQIWRYKGTQDPDSPAEELDGRWRFVLFDIDASMFRQYWNPPSEKSITRLLRGQYQSPIFTALMQHDKYREMFSNYICDMVSGHFSIENVKRVVEQLNSTSLREIEISTASVDRDFNDILDSREDLFEYFRARPEYIFDELRELFGYTSMYRIVSKGSCKINSLNVSEGSYFVGNHVPVVPAAEKGRVFSHWIVNGAVRYERELLLSAADADSQGVIHLELITQESLPPLFFKDTFDSGDLFGFTMYNPNNTYQSTQELYLSDNIGNLKKWKFPANFRVYPGSVLEFVGKNSTSLDALLKIKLNFNPRKGEVIFLSNEDGEILDFIVMVE